MIRTITVEREYGAGGGVIARKLATRLGSKLWDELTCEIARVAKVDRAVEEKIRRLCEAGKGEDQAIDEFENVDRQRVIFIRKYFGMEWPTRAAQKIRSGLTWQGRS